MPLPRLDASESYFERIWSRHRGSIRQLKQPACGVLGIIVVLGLWEHAHVIRASGRSSSSVPSMNLGWQSGFAAYSALPETALPAATAAANATGNSTAAASSAEGGADQNGDGWAGNAIAEEWDPFVPNMAPLIEVTAKSCMWPPSVYDACVPDSSLREDAERGKWVRVEKDLNLRAGICECLRPVPIEHGGTANVRLARLIRLHLPLVSDMIHDQAASARLTQNAFLPPQLPPPSTARSGRADCARVPPIDRQGARSTAPGSRRWLASRRAEPPSRYLAATRECPLVLSHGREE